MRNRAVHNSDTGSHWALSLLFSLVLELVPMYNVETDHFNGTPVHISARWPFDPHLFLVSEAKNCVNTYNAFVNRVEELKLTKSVDDKPLLDVSLLADSCEQKFTTGNRVEKLSKFLEQPNPDNGLAESSSKSWNGNFRIQMHPRKAVELGYSRNKNQVIS